MKVRKGNCRIFSIYKKNINENVFLELKGDTITYFKESNNNGPAQDFKSNIAPKLISDVNFVTQIIEELYTPVKKDIRHYKEELEAIEVESLTRVKNTATYIMITGTELQAGSVPAYLCILFDIYMKTGYINMVSLYI